MSQGSGCLELGTDVEHLEIDQKHCACGAAGHGTVFPVTGGYLGPAPTLGHCVVAFAPN